MKDKNKLVISIMGIIVSILIVLSVSYAAMSYNKTGASQKLVLGDIWMKYTETSGLSITNAMPGDDYSKYFEFTISGTNTYTKKDIYYDFILTRGDLPEGKSENDRIPDEYLKFKLVSLDENNNEIIIFKDVTYIDLTNQRIYVETILKNTTDIINRKYRLYMTIDNSLEIGNTSTAIFKTDEWDMAFASVKVNVTGDFSEKNLQNFSEQFKSLLLTTKSNFYLEDLDGTIYLSGEKDDYNPKTTNDVDFNYVSYSGYLFRIVGINPDGTLKLVTNDIVEIMPLESDYEYSNSLIRNYLNQEFLDTLYSYQEIIVDNYNWNSTILTNYTEKPNTANNTNDLVGMLNAYEYYKSYEKTDSSNGYLNIDSSFLTINNSSDTAVWNVNNNGELINLDFTNGLQESGVRASINLKYDIKVVSGNGSYNNPYILAESIPNIFQVIKRDNKIFADNINSTFVNNETPGIDFRKQNSDTNGKGVYYTADTSLNEDFNGDGIGERVYYYRGDVNNNNLVFANYCWKIIRTNEDGSIKLRYNGKYDENNKCTVVSNIGSSYYNHTYGDNSYVGYMMGLDNQCTDSTCSGTIRSASYNEAHANIYDSSVKKVIDNWYENNILPLGIETTSKIANTIYCNDRSIITADDGYTGTYTQKGFSNNTTSYSAILRLEGNKPIQYKCNQNNDKFTLREDSGGVSGYGNNALKYPIALLTADEFVYAGNIYTTENKNNFLYFDTYYWSMSPGTASATRVGSCSLEKGAIYNDRVVYAEGVFPAISLYKNVLVKSGTGLPTDPYIV